MKTTPVSKDALAKSFILLFIGVFVTPTGLILNSTGTTFCGALFILMSLINLGVAVFKKKY